MILVLAAKPCSWEIEGGIAHGKGTMARILTVIGALAALTLLGGWAFDRQGAFCVFDRDYTNCGYPSWEACIEAAHGVGGNCRPNPQYLPERQSRRAKYR